MSAEVICCSGACVHGILAGPLPAQLVLHVDSRMISNKCQDVKCQDDKYHDDNQSNISTSLSSEHFFLLPTFQVFFSAM